MRSRVPPIVRAFAVLTAIQFSAAAFAEPPADIKATPANKSAAQTPSTPAKSDVAPAKSATPAAPTLPQGPTPTVVLKEGEVPKADFDTLVYDFGKAKSGKDIEHDFWFHNTGTGPLEILAVKPSCGCTTSGQYNRVVQPGQSGKIPIMVNTGHATGPITKSITVTTNVAGAGATVALQVKGDLWQLIQATPNSAMFGNISPAQTKDGPAVRKLTIANNGDTPIKLSDLKSTTPAFTGDLKELETGKKWELTVTLASKEQSGAQSGTIEFNTGNTELPKLQIACNAYMVADVDVVPNTLMLPSSRTASLQRDFYVRNNGSKPLHLSDLATSSPLMKVGMQETQTGMSYRITLDVPPDYKMPKDGDTITFKTDNPSFPTFKIPVTEAAIPAPTMQAAAPIATKGVAPATNTAGGASAVAKAPSSPAKSVQTPVLGTRQ